MQPHYKPLALALAAALQLAAIATVPLAWEARPNAPAPAFFDRHHGETLEFRCTLRGFDAAFAPAADVRLWYQTNGMGQAWWSAPATVQSNVITATWSPALDPGADRVSLFFGAPSNVYASAVLRLRHSPGFTPSVLTLPVQRLDFAAVEIANAPYYTKAETESKIAELAPVPGDYETVSNKTTAIGLEDEYWRFYGMADQAMYAQTASQLSFNGGLHMLYFNGVEGRWISNEYYGLENHGLAYLDDIPSPPDLTPYATKTELGSVSETANAAALDAARTLRIVLGESVWFAVTNYMRTAEGVIPSLQLWEVRDSVTNLVYDSREEITNTVKALTRELHTELTNRIHAVSNAMPSKAWGNYQSDGTDNPEPGKVAIINPPTVILTGGGTFNKYLEVGDSSLWVLQSSGPVTFGGNTNGNYFAVLDDEGKPHFRVAKTDSYDLPAFISGILPRQSQNHILIYTATTNRHGNAVTEHPTISVCSDLKESVWHEEVDGEIDALGISVSWTRDDTIPAWVATVTPDNYPPNLYFRCKVVQEGGVAVINTAPTRFDGGVQFGNGTYRLVPYTTGGKTYLTLEH